MKGPKISSILPILLAVVTTTVCIGFLQSYRLKSLSRSASNAVDQVALRREEAQQQFQLSLLAVASDFGFRNLVANWTFLNFLQYFGDTNVRSRVGYRLSSDFFRIIVDRDPKFIETYIYLSTSISIHAGEPEASIELMNKGLNSMLPTSPPTSYFVWRHKGIDQLLFLGDGKSAQQSFTNAALWAEQSPDPEALSVAESSRRTAEFLENNSASTSAQISAWAQVLVRAVDEYTIGLATERIEALGGEIIVSSAGVVSVRHRADD